MPIKKSVKKVEIADDSVLDLKSRDRSKDDVSFHVHHIEDSTESSETPEGFMELPRRTVTTEAIMERAPRSPRYDAEALHDRMESFAEKLEKAVIKVSPQENGEMANVASKPKDLIKVKFEKFVTLVASKDFLSVLERNRDEDIVLSSNLLTELASATEEKQEKKSPVIFLVGLALGVIITYLLINR
jgi:hypothetical protein